MIIDLQYADFDHKGLIWSNSKFQYDVTLALQTQ